MHLLTLVSSLFAQQKSAPIQPERAQLDNGADGAELAAVKRQLAAMGFRLHVAPRAVRAKRARRILWAVWSERFARGEESRSFDAFMLGCR